MSDVPAMQRDLADPLLEIRAHLTALMEGGGLSERQLVIVDAIDQALERFRLILDDPIAYFKNATSDEDFLNECADPARLAHFVAFDLNNPTLIVAMSARILLNHERPDFYPLTDVHRDHLQRIEARATAMRELLNRYRQ